MPRRAGGRAVTSCSPMKMLPLVTSSRPAMSRSVVDFPQPEGPSSTTKQPAGASKLTSSTARVAPQALLTPRRLIADNRSSSPLPLRCNATARPLADDEVFRVGLDAFLQRRRRRAPQHPGIGRIRDRLRVAHVLLHLLEVQVLSLEVALGVFVGARELQVEALGGIHVEPRRLVHEIVARGEDDLGLAVWKLAFGEAAEDELGVEAVAAFLQVTTVGHLRDDVRGAEHVADAAQQRVV